MMDAVEDVVRGAVSVLSARPSALITDIDGTLSPIVSRPEDAVVSDSVRESLRALAGLIDLVAVVTGRSEDEARRMVGVEGLTYVGHYSLDDSAAARIRPDELEPAKASARSMLGPYPCVQFEDKGVSFSLHYRNCEDEGVRDELMTLMRPLAQRSGARLLEGKQVIEMVPGDLPDKSAAVSRLLEEHGIRGVVYLGDDLSDVAVFRELARRRAEGGVSALSAAVVDAETDDLVSQAADVRLDGVRELEALLACLCETLGGTA